MGTVERTCRNSTSSSGVLKGQGYPTTHCHKHPLIRFKDSCAVKPDQGKATTLEKQLAEMELRLNAGLSSLDNKVNQQLNVMSSGMMASSESMGKDEERFEAAKGKMLDRPVMIGDMNGGLEGDGEKVDERVLKLENRLGERLQALESTVEVRLERLVALLWQLVVPTHQGGANESARGSTV
ncbi:hypothetical protein B0H34DRAFT_726717 [Crassisporium funariophilum]|nr:hypothetical protein B0H34DRAFT_726717 [Crassisporium funariophilum]